MFIPLQARTAAVACSGAMTTVHPAPHARGVDGSALDRDQFGRRTRACVTRTRGRYRAEARRECGVRSELALGWRCARGCDRIAVERDRRKLDARDDTGWMLGRKWKPDLELGASDELPRDAQRARRFVVRVVRGGAV